MTSETSVPCPYKSLPDTAFWRRSVTRVSPDCVDPIVSTKFKITPEDKIATSGSCFAQHIARYLQNKGYNYYVTEKGPEFLPEDVKQRFNYGTFSARYANIYTTRQLLQTFHRAYGIFEPQDNVWVDGKRFIDPYRPFIQPRGFTSIKEFENDRRSHYASIREMTETMDVFIFTLGLTETWLNKKDGAAYPIAPGCGAGEHRPHEHAFHNLSVQETVDDLCDTIDLIKSKNKNARILLTVSPVPLIATMEDRHVLTSTVYSKSVLRVAADMAASRYAHVDYFPSYEIITGNFTAGSYYQDDWREVWEPGVEHVMSCFFRHYMDLEIDRDFVGKIVPKRTKDTVTGITPERKVETTTPTKSQKFAKVICDEEEMEKSL